MKEKIVKLSNGMECYVIEEVIVDRRKFCLAYEANTEEGILYNRFMILEEKMDNGKVIVTGVSDEERMNITSLIIDKIRNSIEGSNI